MMKMLSRLSNLLFPPFDQDEFDKRAEAAFGTEMDRAIDRGIVLDKFVYEEAGLFREGHRRTWFIKGDYAHAAMEGIMQGHKRRNG